MSIATETPSEENTVSRGKIHTRLLAQANRPFTRETLSIWAKSVGITIRHFGDPESWTLGSALLRDDVNEPVLLRFVRLNEGVSGGVKVELTWLGEPLEEALVESLRLSLVSSLGSLEED